MTSKERLLIALDRRRPDRLPVACHQWQGYHLQTYMGGLDDLAANIAVGFDAHFPKPVDPAALISTLSRIAR